MLLLLLVVLVQLPSPHADTEDRHENQKGDASDHDPVPAVLCLSIRFAITEKRGRRIEVSLLPSFEES